MLVKKIVFLLIASIVSSSINISIAAASQQRDIYVDGYDIAICRNDGLIPAKAVFEAMGYNVEFTDRELSVTDGVTTFKISTDISAVKEQYGKVENIKMNSVPISAEDDLWISPYAIGQLDGSKVTVTDQKIVISTKDKKEWYYDYPTMAEGDLVYSTNASSTRQNFGSDFGWGMYTQRLGFEETRNSLSLAEQNNKRACGYMEGSGTVGNYVLAFGSEPDETYSKFYPEDTVHSLDTAKIPDANVWGLFYYKDNYEALSGMPFRRYTGIHAEINSQDFVQPDYSAQNTGIDSGYAVYPDGSSAQGYLEANDDLPYPMNAKIYDAVCSKNIDGGLWSELDHKFLGEPQTEADKALVEGFSKTQVGSAIAPFWNYGQWGSLYFGSFSLAKDVAAPFWKEYNRISLENVMKFGLDGLWVDNYSLWDNFSSYANMFGDWSEYRFNEYLKSNFTEQELLDFGIDINNFNIREYIANSGVSVSDYNWVNDPVWSAYKVFKKSIGSQYLKDLYSDAKSLAEEYGKDDGFLIMGNDINVFNHGWVENGWLDICGTELTTGANPMTGRQGIGRPDEGGRMAAVYKTFIPNQKATFSIPWLYVGDYSNKTELGKVWLAEAFANSSLIKAADNCAGSTESHKWLNDFINESKSVLDVRYDYSDVAIVFSPPTQLATAIPNTFLAINEDENMHFQGVLGFGHFLVNNNIPYDVIPTWKFNENSIKKYKTLILPNVEVMDEEMAQMLAEFVSEGGKVILSGANGVTKTEEENFERYDVPVLNTVFEGLDVTSGIKTGDEDVIIDNQPFTELNVDNGKVVYIPQPIGYQYYISKESRSFLNDDLLSIMGDSAQTLISSEKVPENVGTFLSRSADAEKYFVDIVNYNVNAESDTVTPVENIELDVLLPFNTDYKARIISPDAETGGEADIQYDESTGKYKLTIPYVNIYSVVVISEEESTLGDEFSGNELTGWTFVNDSQKNYSVEDDHLNISSFVPGANSSENMVYMNDPLEGDFTAVIKFKPNASTYDGQVAGVFLYQDWNNKFSFFVSGKGNDYMIVNYDGHAPDAPYNRIIPNSDGYVYFKITRTGDEYKFSYGVDGVNFTDEITKTFDFSDVHIGLTAKTELYGADYPQSPDDVKNFTANFDYVRIYQGSDEIKVYLDGNMIDSIPEGRNTINIKVPVSADITDRKVIAAAGVYEGLELKSVVVQEVDEISKMCTLDVDIDKNDSTYIKVFVWDSETLSPLDEAYLLF